MVSLRQVQPPGSQFTLFQVLKEILEKEPNYSMLKATNGEFCKPL